MSEPIKVEMLGSEWFASRTGGLNRYFDSLFSALQQHPAVAVEAWALGDPPTGGRSLGKLKATAWTRAIARPQGSGRDLDIFDRHFALYGNAARRQRKSGTQLFHFHGPWADESAASGEGRVAIAVKRTIEKQVYSQIDQFVVLSSAFAKLLAERYEVSNDKIVVIPPGVDLDKFSMQDRASGRPTVMCVRRLERRMGIDVLIRAWPDVIEIYPDAELRIVGTGTYEADLRMLAAASPALSTINFSGSISDSALAQEYEKSTVTVVPSVGLEGFGLITLESLASGRPPIVTANGGLPDSVMGLDPTLVVPVNDPGALAKRIVEALSGDVPSPEACRAHAELFSWSVCADRHAALYASLKQGAIN